MRSKSIWTHTPIWEQNKRFLSCCWLYSSWFPLPTWEPTPDRKFLNTFQSKCMFSILMIYAAKHYFKERFNYKVIWGLQRKMEGLTHPMRKCKQIQQDVDLQENRKVPRLLMLGPPEKYMGWVQEFLMA